MKEIEALVFEGGGVKGIAHCGALMQLERFGLQVYDIMFLAGTSAGSQIATLLACGYTVNELHMIVTNMPLDDFMDKNCGCFRNMTRLLCSYGIFKGDYMEEFIDDLIATKMGKKKATFMDLYIQTLKNLRITGTCLSTSNLEYFDVTLTPDMPISKAVRISSSIPFVYSAVKYKDKYYVDGGVIRNLPMYAFPNKPTIFLTFKDEVLKTTENKPKHKITNLVNFLMSLLDVAVIHSNQVVDNGLEKSNPHSMKIEIDTLHIRGLDFDLHDDDKTLLIQQGKNAVINK
jgi:NTE family protein